MSSVSPAEPESTDSAPEPPETLAFTSAPALMTALVLSAVLMIGAIYWWGALGKEIRDQVSWSQGAVWLTLLFIMVGIMLSVGYSRIWAEPGQVTVRNGPLMKKLPIDHIAGLRLRQNDPWAYILVKADGELKRVPVLAIQRAEGNGARKKVNQLRAWLKGNGATSKGYSSDPKD